MQTFGEAALNSIFCKFPTESQAADFELIGSGHINRTWLVTTEGGARYILQRVNREVFPRVDVMMENIALVQHELERRGVETIHFLDAQTGGNWLDDGAGGAWRVYPFVENSVSKLRADSPEDFCESGRAFGGFLAALRDLDPTRLEETIPRFHYTPGRFGQLRAAMEKDACGRRKEVQKELDFALAREERAGELWRLHAAGKLPLRVTHSDTKLSNVLFDSVSGRARCVIDLDTVMPGLSAYDFGDAIRFGASTGSEDEPDLRKVNFDSSLFRAFARGYLEACRCLTEEEVRVLPLGAWTITLENGVRFLADYLNGDTYYKTERAGQNLDRCRTQLKLVSDMEACFDGMRQIIAEEAAR